MFSNSNSMVFQDAPHLRITSICHEQQSLLPLLPTNRSVGVKQDVQIISQFIQTEIRFASRARKNPRVAKILEEFKDLPRMADVRGSGKKFSIGSAMPKMV